MNHDEHDSDDLELVTVATFMYPAQAHVARGRLESEGIRAFVADENLITMNWLYANTIGGVKLQVSAADADRARAILEQTPETFDDAAVDEEDGWGQ